MDYRYLGRSGLQVSALTYGNWLTHASQIANDTAVACVRRALDLGITTFDTADTYSNGAAESLLAQALKGVRRESVEITTKVYFPVGPEPRGRNDAGLSRKHIMEGINGSLRRLGMDYVDVYQAHRFDSFTPLEETMQAFADVVRAGKALYIGVSEWEAGRLREGQELARRLGFTLVSNQAQYSMLWRPIEAEVVPVSAELGISQVAWSPLAQGVLTGKYMPGEAPPAGSRATDTAGQGADMIRRWMDDSVLSAIQRLRPIAFELDLTIAQLALAWVLSHDHIASAVIGASRPEQIEENVRAAEVALDLDVLSAIDQALEGVVSSDPALTSGFTPQRRPA